jgi:cleavage stimulation factor subunit 3
MSSDQQPPEDMAVDNGDSTQQSQEPNSPIKAESPARTASDFDVLFADLKEHPHNPDGWRRLVEMAESGGEAEKIRMIFDALLRQYPNTVSLVSSYGIASLNVPS